jgi:hypothetical protein
MSRFVKKKFLQVNFIFGGRCHERVQCIVDIFITTPNLLSFLFLYWKDLGVAHCIPSDRGMDGPQPGPFVPP